jgi:hypothetical protein
MTLKTRLVPCLGVMGAPAALQARGHANKKGGSRP